MSRSALYPLTLAIPLALATALPAGCEGKIVDPSTTVADDTPASSTRFPRLTHQQWENTVQDLFRLPEPPGLVGEFDADPPLGRFDNNVQRLQVTAGLWRDYQRAAENLAETVTGDGEALARIVPDDLPDSGDARARGFIEAFGARAFRRPLVPAEVDRYAALFAEGPEHFASGDAFVDGVRITLEGMLQSPHFVYRVESSSEPTERLVPLSSYEVASRLSYLFWNTMPDDELFAAAAGGGLASEDGIRAQALRLLDDPRTRVSLRHFHDQLYALDEYADLDKDPGAFPNWSRELGAMMRTEARMFLDSVIFDRDGAVGDLLTASHTFVNDQLAPLYGLEGQFSAEFVEVELDPTTRAGFLTRLGFLTRNATLAEPDPIHRGVFVNLDVLCRPISAPPSLPDELNPVGDTNRERIESITGFGTCGEACHGRIINPIGFALEHYDAIGRYRPNDNGFPINSADTYVFEDGREIMFTNGIELSKLLAASPQVHACYVGNLFEYAFGRDLESGEMDALGGLVTASVDGGVSIRELLVGVVTSKAFRFRPVADGQE